MRALTIREFQIGDLEQVILLLQELWPTKKLNSLKIEKIFKGKMKDKNQYLQLVAVGGNEVVGLITMSWRLNLYSEGNMACIDDLVVAKKHRNKGIGEKLVQEVLKVCKAKKLTGVYLISAFHRKGAHIFYKKLGFKKDSFQFEKYFRN